MRVSLAEPALCARLVDYGEDDEHESGATNHRDPAPAMTNLADELDPLWAAAGHEQIDEHDPFEHAEEHDPLEQDDGLETIWEAEERDIGIEPFPRFPTASPSKVSSSSERPTSALSTTAQLGSEAPTPDAPDAPSAPFSSPVRNAWDESELRQRFSGINSDGILEHTPTGTHEHPNHLTVFEMASLAGRRAFLEQLEHTRRPDSPSAMPDNALPPDPDAMDLDPIRWYDMTTDTAGSDDSTEMASSVRSSPPGSVIITPAHEPESTATEGPPIRDSSYVQLVSPKSGKSVAFAEDVTEHEDGAHKICKIKSGHASEARGTDRENATEEAMEWFHSFDEGNHSTGDAGQTSSLDDAQPLKRKLDVSECEPTETIQDLSIRHEQTMPEDDTESIPVAKKQLSFNDLKLGTSNSMMDTPSTNTQDRSSSTVSNASSSEHGIDEHPRPRTPRQAYHDTILQKLENRRQRFSAEKEAQKTKLRESMDRDWNNRSNTSSPSSKDSFSSRHPHDFYHDSAAQNSSPDSVYANSASKTAKAARMSTPTLSLASMRRRVSTDSGTDQLPHSPRIVVTPPGPPGHYAWSSPMQGNASSTPASAPPTPNRPLSELMEEVVKTPDRIESERPRKVLVTASTPEKPEKPQKPKETETTEKESDTAHAATHNDTELRDALIRMSAELDVQSLGLHELHQEIELLYERLGHALLFAEVLVATLTIVVIGVVSWIFREQDVIIGGW